MTKLKKLFIIFLISISLIILNQSVSKSASTIDPPANLSDFINLLLTPYSNYVKIDPQKLAKTTYTGSTDGGRVSTGNSWATCLAQTNNGYGNNLWRIVNVIDVHGSGNVEVYRGDSVVKFNYSELKNDPGSNRFKYLKYFNNLAYVNSTYTFNPSADLSGYDYVHAYTRYLAQLGLIRDIPHNLQSWETNLINQINSQYNTGNVLTHTIGKDKKVRFVVIQGASDQDKILYGIGQDDESGEILITKVDANNSNKKIAGVGFNIYKFKSGANWKYYNDKEQKIGYIETGSTGTATFGQKKEEKDQLEVGQKYAIIEVKTPEHYKKSTEVYTVELKAGTNPVLIKNVPNTIKIIKKDANHPDAKLSGANFWVCNPIIEGGKIVTDVNRYKTKDKIGNTITTKDGVVICNNEKLKKNGKYIIFEIRSPEGYSKTDDSGDGKTQYQIINSLNEGENEVTFTDFRVSVQAKKVDAQTKKPLAGAEFSIYNYSASYGTNRSKYINDKDKLIGTMTSGSDGIAKLENSRDLHIGRSYAILESKAPSGYEVSNKVERIKIHKGANGTTLTFEDEKDVPSLKVKKREAKTNKPLAGATFWVCKYDGNYGTDKNKYLSNTRLRIATIQSKSDGFAYLNSGLEEGKKYVVFESSAPTGYKVANKVVNVEIKKGVNQIDEPFINEPINTPPTPTPTPTLKECSIKVIKVGDDGVGQYSLEGIKFKINVEEVNNPGSAPREPTEPTEPREPTKPSIQEPLRSNYPDGDEGQAQYDEAKKKYDDAMKKYDDAMKKYNDEITRYNTDWRYWKYYEIPEWEEEYEEWSRKKAIYDWYLKDKSRLDGKIFETDSNGIIEIGDLCTEITYYATELDSGSANSQYEYSKERFELKSNGETLIEHTVVNTRKLINLSGYVWEEIKDTKGYSELGDGVYSEDVDRRVGKGDVKVILKKGSSEIKSTFTDENGEYRFSDVNYEDLANLTIEFEYNGLKYRDTKLVTSADNGSKAHEIQSSRNNLSDKFYQVTIGNEEGHTYNYNGEDHTSSIDYGSTERYGKDMYHVRASTAGFNLFDYYKSFDEERKQDTLPDINFGIIERTQADLAILKDTKNVKVSINGYDHIYNYGTAMRRKEDDEQYTGTDSETFDFKTKFETGDINQPYTRAIYPSDVSFNPENTDKALKVYITYEIKVKNKTDLTNKIYSIRELYSSEYQNPKVAKTLEGIENGNSEGFTFNEGLIKLGEGVTIEPGTTQTVAYIQFMLDRKAVEGIIGQNDNSTGLENVAEIGDFGTFDRDGNKYAAIDKNSRPGNTVFGNIDTYEDDTDIAPAMRLEYGNNRDVSGMVFLDSTRAETIVNTIREGDGVYGDGDQGIDGVEILLEETSGSGLSYHATTFDGGGYSFNGFIPGEYKMTFTWGDGNYPIKNYKGTIYLDKERQYNEYWYMDEATRYSDAMDDWGKRQNIDNGNSSDTKMISTTPKMKINVEKLVGTGEGNKKTQSEPKDQTDPTANNFIISNVDFGITERARQEIKANKNVSRIEIKLPNGQTIAKAEFDENGDFADGYKDEKDHKYITKEGIIKAELDSELIQGSTLYVDYNINVNNIGELDYYSEDYYLYGFEQAKANLRDEDKVGVKLNEIQDYLDSNLVWTDDGKWNKVANIDINSIENYIKEENRTRITGLNKTNDNLILPNEKDTLICKASKLLNTGDTLNFNANIVLVPNPTTGTKTEIYGPGVNPTNAESSDVVITNATGENRDYQSPIIIVISVLTAIAIVTTTALIIIKRKKS